MTSREAADIIGCGVRHVRYLIRTGRLRATWREYPIGVGCYDVYAVDVYRYAEQDQPTGYPRGRRRKERRNAKKN